MQLQGVQLYVTVERQNMDFRSSNEKVVLKKFNSLWVMQDFLKSPLRLMICTCLSACEKCKKKNKKIILYFVVNTRHLKT